MKFKKQKPPVSRRPASGHASRPQAFSYYSQRSTTPQPGTNRQPGRFAMKPKRDTLKYVAQRFGAIVALLALFLLFITSVQVTMQPRVQLLNESDTIQLHSATDYQVATEQIMKRSWTNTNKLTINTRSIGQQLQTEYPEIADASIELPLVGQRPIVYLQLTEPQLILVNASGQAFLVDEKGRALADAAQVDSSVVSKLPTVTDESGLQLSQGEVAMSSADVRFVTSVLYQLRQANVAVSKLTLPQGSRELDVYLYGQSYYVKFNLHEGGPMQQVGALLAVRQQLDAQGKSPSKYIDVRLLGRAYYK
ncbi:hypothetical protein KDA23_07420 [Candidatus Saccharibacteria bacterium]|nr:hypothetical protein [Candidatus Saccharibacteria bacterium]